MWNRRDLAGWIDNPSFEVFMDPNYARHSQYNNRRRILMTWLLVWTGDILVTLVKRRAKVMGQVSRGSIGCIQGPEVPLYLAFCPQKDAKPCC